VETIPLTGQAAVAKGGTSKTDVPGGVRCSGPVGVPADSDRFLNFGDAGRAEETLGQGTTCD